MSKTKNMLGLAFLLSIPLAASADTTYTFDSVSKIEHGGNVLITGVLVETSTPTTVTAPNAFESRCVPLYHQMLGTPGMYFLSVTTGTSSGPGGVGVVTFLVSCSLELKP